MSFFRTQLNYQLHYTAAALLAKGGKITDQSGRSKKEKDMDMNEKIEILKSEFQVLLKKGQDWLEHLSVNLNRQQLVQYLPPIVDKEWVQNIPPIQLYVALLVLFLTVFLLFIVRFFNRKTSNTIVLTGLNGSGKTYLFFQLRDGEVHQGTVTSMQHNEDSFVLHSEITKKGKTKPVHVVDVPGGTQTKLDEFLPQAAGVVFVVDAVEFLPKARAVSEYLYDILTKASVVKKSIPVLILCNKVDKVTAHTKEFIRKQLEKEIEKLRASRNVVSEADVTNEFTLGIPGETFAFSHCRNKVTVAEASGATGEITQLELFIRECVKP